MGRASTAHVRQRVKLAEKTALEFSENQNFWRISIKYYALWFIVDFPTWFSNEDDGMQGSQRMNKSLLYEESETTKLKWLISWSLTTKWQRKKSLFRGSENYFAMRRNVQKLFNTLVAKSSPLNDLADFPLHHFLCEGIKTSHFE